MIKRKIISIFICLSLIACSLCGCDLEVSSGVKIDADEKTVEKESSDGDKAGGGASGNEEAAQGAPSDQYKISYRILGADEGREVLLSNTQFYSKLTKEDLRYRLQRKDASMEAYLDFLKEQVLDHTPEEEAAIADAVSFIEDRFTELGFKWPISEDILFIKTTGDEEPGAGGYTHKTQIYLGADDLVYGYSDDETEKDLFRGLVAHEFCHALTRNVPEFREKLYGLIGFTVDEKEPAFSDGVREQILSNPDVEAFDCHAQFTIDGQKTDATIVPRIVKPYEDGAVMLESVEAVLVPIDTPDHFVAIDDVPDFYDVVGRNTGYVIAAEECMADNFADAVIYGMDHDYENPEIVQGILDVMSGF